MIQLLIMREYLYHSMANPQPNACCEHDGKGGTDSGTGKMTCYCPLDDVLKTVRKKYTMQIIALLGAEGPLRYIQLKTRLGTKSDATLSKRLDQLEDAGLVDRERYDEMPPRVEYSLTAAGRELEDHIQPLLDWAARTDESTTPPYSR